MELIILLLLAPIAWGALCAAVPLAIVFIMRRNGCPGATLLAFSWLVGFLAAEFEVVGTLLGHNFDGQCIVQSNDFMGTKFAQSRPCSFAEWRMEKLFPAQGGFYKLTWWFRIAVAAAYNAFFMLCVMLWSREANRQRG